RRREGRQAGRPGSYFQLLPAIAGIGARNIVPTVPPRPRPCISKVFLLGGIVPRGEMIVPGIVPAAEGIVPHRPPSLVVFLGGCVPWGRWGRWGRCLAGLFSFHLAHRHGAGALAARGGAGGPLEADVIARRQKVGDEPFQPTGQDVGL